MDDSKLRRIGIFVAFVATVIAEMFLYGRTMWIRVPVGMAVLVLVYLAAEALLRKLDTSRVREKK